jgi:FMN phosphatase YigB (HAD superfamily)
MTAVQLPSALKAIVFDVDGTLYRQDLVRKAMFVRLLRAHVAHPLLGWQTARILHAYRRAQEDMRDRAVSRDIAEAQINCACERAHVEPDVVVACVARWMEQEPLAILAACIQPGLTDFLQACKARGIRIGALSDYPVEAKLKALGIAHFFDIALCAQDPAIDRFKPDPRGLLVALDRLGSTASETIYVGDRLDVDAPTAQAAGVRCAIVTRHAPPAFAGPICVATYSELHALVLA